MTNCDCKKLLAIDLDGTLLTDNGNITEGNLKSLKKASEKNTTIAIATGRAFFNALRVIDKYGFDCYLICFNGALIVNLKNNEEIFSKTMEKEAAQKIVDLCIGEKLPLHVFGKTYWGINFMDEAVKEFVEKQNIHPNIIRDARQIEDIDIINLVGIGKVDKISEFIVKNNMKVSFTNSDKESIDVMGENVNKGNALEILADKLNFRKEEIISIGNYYNDVEMFKMSNTGIAIQNSPDDVKLHADYVTQNSNNEEGVKEAIEKFIL